MPQPGRQWPRTPAVESCDVIGHVTIWYPECYFLKVFHCNRVRQPFSRYWSPKHIVDSTLTFQGHVTSWITWPFDSPCRFLLAVYCNRTSISRPMTRPEFLVQVSRTRNSHENLVSFVMHSRTRFFSCEKLGPIRTCSIFARETWHHVTQMNLCHWPTVILSLCASWQLYTFIYTAVHKNVHLFFTIALANIGQF